MKEISKKIIIVTVIIVMIFGFHVPNKADATGGISYGGLKTLTLPCTCSGNAVIYLLDFKTKLPLVLLYQPGVSWLYQWYNIFGTYMLGTYTVPVSQCWIQTGTTCTLIPTIIMLGGKIIGGPGTGTTPF